MGAKRPVRAPHRANAGVPTVGVEQSAAATAAFVPCTPPPGGPAGGKARATALWALAQAQGAGSSHLLSAGLPPACPWKARV